MKYIHVCGDVRAIDDDAVQFTDDPRWAVATRTGRKIARKVVFESEKEALAAAAKWRALEIDRHFPGCGCGAQYVAQACYDALQHAVSHRQIGQSDQRDADVTLILERAAAVRATHGDEAAAPFEECAKLIARGYLRVPIGDEQ